MLAWQQQLPPLLLLRAGGKLHPLLLQRIPPAAIHGRCCYFSSEGPPPPRAANPLPSHLSYHPKDDDIHKRHLLRKRMNRRNLLYFHLETATITTKPPRKKRKKTKPRTGTESPFYPAPVIHSSSGIKRNPVQKLLQRRWNKCRTSIKNRHLSNPMRQQTFGTILQQAIPAALATLPYSSSSSSSMLRFQILQTESSISKLADIAMKTYIQWKQEQYNPRRRGGETITTKTKTNNHYQYEEEEEEEEEEEDTNTTTKSNRKQKRRHPPKYKYASRTEREQHDAELLTTAERIWTKWRNVGAYLIVILREIPPHSIVSSSTSSNNTVQKDLDMDEEDDPDASFKNVVFNFSNTTTPNTTTNAETTSSSASSSSSSSSPPPPLRLYHVLPFRPPDTGHTMQQYAYAHAATQALYLYLRNHHYDPNHRSVNPQPFVVTDHRHELFVHTRAFRNQFIHQEQTDRVIALFAMGYTETRPRHQRMKKNPMIRPKRKYDFTNNNNNDDGDGMVLDIIDYCF